ncbi:hypothetical protein HYH03_000298 [Edaphochlamys debaryana]|uniref:Pherophorin domain-containing protein n=1 Tax=Edaphochlamys debaryana TaxID=47281 RepID=A0A835YFJ8_9CHLO|nr:hypothetical protein HYH03_000298 [Edaphochlamys debaryana]|eukprot:KAG2501798.1 hypothetical protein HYH03_000298 [Edaphochlamys debaryana]
MLRLLIIAAIAAVAAAQSPPVGAAIPNPELAFPYASCIRPLSTSTYSASPTVSTVMTPAGEKTCWTLRFRTSQCTKPNADINGKNPKCCEQTFHKFEMNIKYECIPPGTAGRPFPATATFKDVPTKGVFSRQFQQTRGVTIFVSSLDTLGTAVEGTQFCLTLNKDSPCPTLATLIPEFPKWSVALWDPNHNCCPVSNGTNPSPPPSRPPRSPRLPPPPAGCETCYEFKVEPTRNGQPGLDWFENPDHCAMAKKSWEDNYLSRPDVNSVITGFTTFTCVGDVARVCGSYDSSQAGDTIAAISELWQILLQDAFNFTSECTAPLKGYNIILEGTNPICGYVNNFFDCKFPPPPFPNCGPCNVNPDSTPFALDQILTTMPATPASTYYCVQVKTQVANPNNNGLYPKYCAKLSALYKVEFWLSWDRRWDIKSIAILDSDSSMPRKIAATWGPKADNTLRVTPLRWGVPYVQDSDPKICFEVLNSVGTIFDLTPRPEEQLLYYVLFDDKQRCCPQSSVTAEE